MHVRAVLSPLCQDLRVGISDLQLDSGRIKCNMDKFLIGEASSTALSTPHGTETEEPASKKAKTLNRQYNEEYLAYGFSRFGDATSPKPECLICREKLSNEVMVPSKLKRHLSAKHPSYLGNDISYFKRLQEQNSKQSSFMKACVKVSDRAQEASYNVAKLIAKAKKPHTIGETLLLPACREIVRCLIGPEAVKEVVKVPLSDDTIKRRIDDMSGDIEATLVEKLR